MLALRGTCTELPILGDSSNFRYTINVLFTAVLIPIRVFEVNAFSGLFSGLSAI